MNLDEFNELCGELTATSSVVQWGDATVWKVGGKVFAIGGWTEGERLGITFKTTREEFDFLVEMDGVRPAPYLGSRGFTWVQEYEDPGLPDDDLREQITESHRLVALGLTKRKQLELGLTCDPVSQSSESKTAPLV
ncbi:MAG: putative DNA-binding protein (MmcQ/YjbR family) [Verrucomicrobiales bacterium]|jgi:predicted DNA-binding protein (MmcQ/YjbR family)